MKIGVGVGVMILQNNNILLGLRNPDKIKASGEIKGEGTWTMPGGKVEFGETLLEAARRETLEETGIIIQQADFLAVQDDITDTAHYVTIGFKVVSWSGIPKVLEPDTILEWEWFPLSNLPNNLYSPSKKLLEKYTSNTYL